MFKVDASYKPQLSEAHVYSLGYTSRFPLLGYFLGLYLLEEIYYLITAIHDQDMHRLWMTLALLILFCLFAVLLWRSGIQRQLIVGSEGIVYVAGMYSLYTPWHNISKVVLSPHNGEPALQLQLPIETLPLEQGIGEQRAVVKSRLRTKRPVQITSRYDIYNYIPLPPKKAGLWQDIQQHVPHLDMTVPSL